MKRIILALAAIICVSSLYSQERFTIGNLTYKVSWLKKVTVKDCNDTATEVNIPATVEHNGHTYTVKSIGKKAFDNCDSLFYVSIPEGVKTIKSQLSIIVTT